MKAFSYALPLLLALTSFTPSSGQATYLSASQILAQAKTVIATLVKGNARLVPEFLRMGFHDCVGGCDGCIDMTNPDNFGLANPIKTLDPVVKQFANPTVGVSRADIWALAVMVAADVVDHGKITKPINFTQNWYGRVNCENANSVCLDAKGQPVPCTQTAGPHRNLPSLSLHSPAVFSFFATNFGFNERQTVTILGAHSMGRMVRNESGIDAPNGWVVDNTKLQNLYYKTLVGEATSSVPFAQKADLSKNFFRTFEDNTELIPPMPSRNYWEMEIDGKKVAMLNVDIALVRELNDANTDLESGAVQCNFNFKTGRPVCPTRPTIDVAVQFAENNDLWLSEFKTTLDLMLTNGYTRTPCSSGVCLLTSTRSGPISPPSTKSPTRKPTAPPSLRPTTKPTQTCVPYLGSCGPLAICCGSFKCTGNSYKMQCL